MFEGETELLDFMISIVMARRITMKAFMRILHRLDPVIMPLSMTCKPIRMVTSTTPKVATNLRWREPL